MRSKACRWGRCIKRLHTFSSCIWGWQSTSGQPQDGGGGVAGVLQGEGLGQGDLRRREGGPTIYSVRSGSMQCVQPAPRGCHRREQGMNVYRAVVLASSLLLLGASLGFAQGHPMSFFVTSV